MRLFIGFTAATCLYDNMKVVVDRWEDDQPIYNRRFLAFAMHYGFRPVACRPRRPQTKGKVERPFDYVEKSLLAGREFRSLEHLNEVTQWWVAEKADVRTHATTGERPIDRHAEERSSLLALPESAYEVHEVVYRVVDAEGFVACEGNRYSVPWKKTRPGEVLAVKITHTELIIYGRDYCEIARHGLFLKTARGEVREDPAHRPPRETRLHRDVLQARFTEFGDVATRFLDGLWQAQRQAPSQAALILELSGLYRRPDFVAALERAVRFGAYSLASVRRILEINARPKSALESLLDSPGDWVDRFENLVMLGQSGVGKSRLLEGIGRRLCVLGKRVRYTTSGDLITQLTASLADGTLPRQVSYWTKFDLLIVDEFGLDYVERQLDPQAGHLLFKVIAARNGKSSTALGTNIEFDAWSEYLGDAPLAMALLDRVVDRAVLLNILGKSYRATRAKRSKAPRPPEPNT